MKLHIDLSKKSVDNAIKRLETVKKNLNNYYQEFLLECYDWFKRHANKLLQLTDIGENVKSGIESGWQYIFTSDNSIKISNVHDSAVYVEFGVGIVGQESPHKNAMQAGYKYNIPSEAKDENGVWRFYKNIADLDMPKSALNYESKQLSESRKRERWFIATAGAAGAMYAYNALIDLKDKGVYEIADKLKAKYWG